MNEKPNYYAIIPANIRYDSELTPNAKLLYGEITALCNEKGYCWATNEYFATLYGVSKVSISNWIGLLIKKGYLSSEIIYKEGTKEILYRYLKLFDDPIKEIFNTPIKENFKDNNTSNNNTFNNKEEIIKEESIFDYYQNEIGGLSPRQYEMINNYIDKYGEDKIKDAINISVDNGVKTFNYFSSVLTNGNYKSKKEVDIPEWIDKKLDYEELTDEELKELEKEMSIFEK